MLEDVLCRPGRQYAALHSLTSRFGELRARRRLREQPSPLRPPRAGPSRVVKNSWGCRYVAPDGEQMLMVRGLEPPPPRQINIVRNWFEELKQRVPTGR